MTKLAHKERFISSSHVNAPSQSMVVERIRRRILSGDLIPGQRLVEAELCELLDASRGTVRAALADLTHEHLIERVANRGARVRVVPLEEALQISEARMAIESLCVSRAAEKISDAEISRLRSMIERLKQCVTDCDMTGFAESTNELVTAYVGIADQPVAEEMLTRLRARISRHQFRLTFLPGRPAVALPFWIDLIEAICARSPVEARAALERHVRNVQDTMRTMADQDRPFVVAYSGGGLR